ncbi:MAG: tetratricopeptide repeat protein [Planctomycetes bacterium]|nr:tetratricopeptide repeat protein [Planctomycetota bacterium]
MKIHFILFPILILVCLSKALFAERYDDANKYYLEAYNLYRFGKMEQSMELLKKVIEIDPDHAEAHFGLGSIYFRQNMYDDAVREFTRVTRIKPEYAQVYERLWLSYKKLGMNDKAEEALQNYKKIMVERMQALSVGPPQVVKPVTTPPQESKVESKPSTTEVETSQPSEMKSSGDTIPGTRLAESARSESEEEEEKEEVEEKEDILSVVKPAIPQLKKSAERSDKEPKTSISETGPPNTKPVYPALQPAKAESDTKLNLKYNSPLTQAKQHTLFKSFKNKSATFFDTPFSAIAEILNKSYIGKLLKGLIYYIITVQIWLCVVTSLFIYFRKKNHKRQISHDL